MKKNLLLLAAMAFLGHSAFAQEITVKDDDLKDGTYTWTTGNTYILDGYVFLESGGTLNIQPGVIIKGKATPSVSGEASSLIITRGATINAIGTAENPIIFTAEADDVSNTADLDETDRGLWGGLVILGAAPVNKKGVTELNVEGIPSTNPKGIMGGTNAADNSGTLKYVSIRHAGNELGVGDELNGLTLGAVGSGTTIDYLEIYANSDDGIEFFGGTVGIKHASIAFCGDDSYDWDLGYSGKGQFWFSINAEDAGDSGMELDGADPDDAALWSHPTVYNLTLIGAGVTSTAPNATGILMRDATGGRIKNAIVTEFANEAIEVEDLDASKGVDSRQRAEDGDLELASITFYNFGKGSEFTSDPTNGIVRRTDAAVDAEWLVTHLKNNGSTLEDPMLVKVDRGMNEMLDPRPKTGSPVLDAAETSALPSGDAFFTTAQYRGAFDSKNLWIFGWTALYQNGHLIQDTTTSGIGEYSNIEDVTIYPNPASDNLNISYNLLSSEQMNIEITDITGKVVATVAKGRQLAGNQLVNLNISNLKAGVYFCKFSGSNTLHTEKFIVR